MPRIELELTVAAGVWTWEEFEALTDRIADALHALPDGAPYVVDPDLAADLSKRTITLAANAPQGDEPVAAALCRVAIEARGEMQYAWGRWAIAFDGSAGPPPVMYPDDVTPPLAG